MNPVTLSAALLLPLLLSACQQTKRPEAAPVPPEAQANQISAVIAGTRYLKYQCGFRELPDDERIEGAARSEAHQRGWEPPQNLNIQSLAFYQQLLQDSTPVAVQCEQFQQLLQPFLATLPRPE